VRPDAGFERLSSRTPFARLRKKRSRDVETAAHTGVYTDSARVVALSYDDVRQHFPQCCTRTGVGPAAAGD
jgi:hypothetical protein